ANTEFVNDWMTENKWFETDPDMTKTARGLLQAELIADNGNQSPKTQLPKVLEEMKRIYPDKFKAPENPNVNRGADVDKGSKAKPKAGKGLKRSDLSESEGLHFDQFVKSGIDEKKLLKTIQEQREVS
ncbi:hypothetical protein LCGC14_1446940, partial [marine sediment metagenome]